MTDAGVRLLATALAIGIGAIGPALGIGMLVSKAPRRSRPSGLT